MRVVIQRVKMASVKIAGKGHSSIGEGLLILVGITHEDGEKEADYLASKSVNLRIFNDEMGLMNRSVQEIEGEILCVSQFTLYAATQKGKRPSFIEAAKGEKAAPLYNYFCEKLSELMGNRIKTGIFGADMQVSLENDGPVTICIDTQIR